tara:strand:+ start:7574 stop:8899 length:1326 start_codon:yes stop_codon:yes gene_type:complete
MALPLNRLKSSVASPVFILLASEVVAKGAMFLSSIPISRLYTPAEMGVFGLYISFATIISIVAGISIQRALPLPRSDGKGFILLLIALGVIILTALLTGLFFTVAPASLLMAVGADHLGSAGLVLPLAVLGWAGFPILQMWLSRTGRFSTLAWSKLSQVALLGGGQIAFGFLHLGGIGLALGDALSRALVLAPFMLRVFRPAAKRLRKPERFTRVALKILMEYKRFPLIVTPTLLLHSIPAAIMPIAIGTHLGTTMAGYWTLSAYVTNAIFGISVSFAPYLYSLWSKSVHSSGLLSPAYVIRSSRPLLVIAAAAGLGLGLAGPFLFTLIFGQEWVYAGQVAQILSVSLAFQILGGPLILVLSVLNREGWNISMAVIWCALSGLVYYLIGAMELSLLQAAGLYATVTCVVYVAYVVLALVAGHLSVQRKRGDHDPAFSAGAS